MSSDTSNNTTTTKDNSNNVVYIDFSNNSTSNDSKTNEETEELPLFVRVFNNSYIIFLFWFIGIYLVVYVFFGVLLTGPRDENAENKMSNTIDILIFSSVLVFAVVQLYTREDWSQDSFVEGTKEFLRDFYGSQLSLFSTMLFILTFYFLLFVLRIPMKPQTKPLSVKFIEFFGLLFLITIFIYDFFKYLLGMDMLDILGDPTVNKLLNAAGSPLNIQLEKPDQVFNVNNNYYTYDDARAVCKAFDSRLATYDEIEKAYDHGAEWCNYGWSEGQMAYFPTQKSTWNKLQESELNKHSCGRPGINGGHFANPYIKFGVNCFGKKPKPTNLEKNMMDTQRETPIPKTEEEIALDEKVKYYKENGDQLLQLNSFSKDKWSRY
jgi:hypothetical protein|tara:strand:- start:3366 stop:4502 length:1137 start_codon:yes stop_codon:yes gene_type:complete